MSDIQLLIVGSVFVQLVTLAWIVYRDVWIANHKYEYEAAVKRWRDYASELECRLAHEMVKSAPKAEPASPEAREE